MMENSKLKTQNSKLNFAFTSLEITGYGKKLNNTSENNKKPYSQNYSALRLPKGRLSLTGFTYIEMMITVVVIAICFVPLSNMFSSSINEVVYAGDKLTALNLARDEMERVKNLNFTEAQLFALGDATIPSKDKPPLSRNNVDWRIERKFMQDSDPLEVKISVWRQGRVPQRIVELVSLIEDLEWTGAD